MSRRIPLSFRVPNPPACFEGREVELSEIADALERSPVVAVFGPPGIGKTSLALAVMHGPLAQVLDRAVYVAVAPSTGEGELVPSLVRALGVATGLEPEIDWPALYESADARVEALIDLAEERGLRVIVDDLSNAAARETGWLLGLLVRYAKNSRWLVLLLERPPADERLFTVGLSGLPNDVMATIATKVSSERPRSAIAQAVADSYGSPGALRFALYGSETHHPLPAIPEDAAPLLHALSVVRVPVPLEVLRSAIAIPSERTLTRLMRYGLLLHSPAGLVLHDVVRRDVGGDELPEHSALAAALLASPSPELYLEGARLSLEAGDVIAVASSLDGRISTLLAEGYANDLWRLIEPRKEEELAAWRSRCAAHLGNPTALYRVPDDELSVDRVTRARALYARGNLRALTERAPDPKADASEWLWFARSQLLRGQAEAALLALLDARIDRERDIRIRALACRAEVLLGRTSEDPIAIARALDRRDGVDQMEAVADLVEALRTLGRSSEVVALIAARFPRLGTALRVERRLLLARAAASIDLGDLAGAEAPLSRLEPFTRSASILRPPIVAQQVRLAILRGELEGLASRLEAARHEAEGYDAKTHAAELHALTLDLELATGRGSPVGSVSAIRKPPGIEGDLLRVAVAETLARRGEPLAGLDTSAWAEPYAFVARSFEKLVAGDHEGALEAALTASSRAVRIAHLPHELRAQAAVCAALVLLGRRTELAVTSEKLAARADATGCARWAWLGQLFSAVSSEDLDYPTLESLVAIGGDTEASRLARWLLGEDLPLDRYEEAIVGASASVRPTLVGSGEPRWGIRRSQRRAWRPGSEHSFSRKRIGWAVLTTLLDAGGEAAKEALVLGAWDVTEYHPIKHDARLQVTIRALREELEDDPSKPTRVLTTDIGYALRGTIRVLP